MKTIRILILFALLGVSSLEGTLGYLLPSYGTRSIGMGGVAIAYPQDTIVASKNPAGMYWVGNRFDAGVQLFSPIRRYKYTLPEPVRRESRQLLFPVPVLGLNRCLNRCMTLGVSIYGNGGMNTYYNCSNPAFGTGKLGIDYAQAVVAPTLAYRIYPCHSVGVSPLIGVQRIKLYGLQNFEAFSGATNDVSNNNYDYAVGGGVRVGWIGNVCNGLWLGASYSTKIYMTKFPNYQGLLVDEAHLHIPAVLIAGFRYDINPCMTVAFDFQRIFYNDVKPLGHGIDRLFEGKLLGSKEGPGFGWDDINAYHVGIDYQLLNCMVVRAGYAYAPVVYSSSQIDANIIAPAVTTHHVTAGMTWEMNCCSEINFAYFHAFHNSRQGTSKFGLGTVTHSMHQNSAEISYAWKY